MGRLCAWCLTKTKKERGQNGNTIKEVQRRFKEGVSYLPADARRPVQVIGGSEKKGKVGAKRRVKYD